MHTHTHTHTYIMPYLTIACLFIVHGIGLKHSPEILLPVCVYVRYDNSKYFRHSPTVVIQTAYPSGFVKRT